MALGLAVVGAGLSASCRRAPREPGDADARIAFYQARLGGLATYPAYAGLGLAYLQKARETGARRHLDSARRYLLESQRRQPNHEALKGLAAVHLARHEFPEALSASEEAVETQSEDPEAAGALFDALLALGEDGKASAVLDGLRRRPPGFATDARLANLEEYRGRLADAREAMQRACTDADRARLPAATRAWCRVRLGALLVMTCEPDIAEQQYAEATTLFPGYYLAMEHLAELAASRGRAREAAAMYEGLLRANADPGHQLAFAEQMRATGDEDRAAALRLTALATLRRSAEAKYRADWRPLALLLLDADATTEEGLRWAERDWANRRDALAADTLAWAYYRRGRLPEASEAIARALSAGTRRPSILLHAAEIAGAAGRTEEARALLDRIPPCREAMSPGEQATFARLSR